MQNKTKKVQQAFQSFKHLFRMKAYLKCFHSFKHLFRMKVYLECAFIEALTNIDDVIKEMSQILEVFQGREPSFDFRQALKIHPHTLLIFLVFSSFFLQYRTITSTLR